MKARRTIAWLLMPACALLMFMAASDGNVAFSVLFALNVALLFLEATKDPS